MADRVSPGKRSEIMAAIKCKDTKLELNFRKSLRHFAVKGFTVKSYSVIGKPDLVNFKGRIAVFLDSCFWHGCKRHLRLPKTNKKYWLTKISRNKKRDRKVNWLLNRNGWRVVRVWEHSLKNDASLRRCLSKIKSLAQSPIPGS